MKNGNITEFIDQLYYGGELVFEYNGGKYFIQGWTSDGVNKLVLDIVSNSTFSKYKWEYEAATMRECAEAFLSAPIWDGKSFEEIQEDVTWSDW